MFERFTQEARDVTIGASVQAHELKDPEINTGHLLLSLLAQEDTVARKVLATLGKDVDQLREEADRARAGTRLDEPDADALAAIGIDLGAIREQAEAAFGPGALDRADKQKRRRGPFANHLPFTPEAKKVLELALREALNLGDRHIGSEHVLLGLVREMGLDLDLRAARVAIRKVRNRPDDPPAPVPAVAP
jgi:ATP-dependent Clp protease ATP-binding subunit ClpA